MGRLLVPLVVALGLALVLPARSYAVGHLVLDLGPSRIAAAAPAKASKQERARLRALATWRLDGRIVGRDFYRPGDPEIFGVTLTRSFPNGHELHALRAAPRETITFDGTRGRLDARFGNTLVVRMEILAIGAPQPADAPLPCRGSFVAVPVALRGTFVLRTGTKLFRTIRRVKVAGVMSFDAAGTVDCTPLPSTVCGTSISLSASSRTSDAMLLMWSNDNGGASLSFADRRQASSAGFTWYHVMYALGSNPLSGSLPNIAARLGSPLPIQGSGAFVAGETSIETNGACRTLSATGSFTGMFQARFAGWGLRRVSLTSADFARYESFS